VSEEILDFEEELPEQGLSDASYAIYLMIELGLLCDATKMLIKRTTEPR